MTRLRSRRSGSQVGGHGGAQRCRWGTKKVRSGWDQVPWSGCAAHAISRSRRTLSTALALRSSVPWPAVAKEKMATRHRVLCSDARSVLLGPSGPRCATPTSQLRGATAPDHPTLAVDGREGSTRPPAPRSTQSTLESGGPTSSASSNFWEAARRPPLRQDASERSAPTAPLFLDHQSIEPPAMPSRTQYPRKTSSHIAARKEATRDT